MNGSADDQTKYSAKYTGGVEDQAVLQVNNDQDPKIDEHDHPERETQRFWLIQPEVREGTGCQDLDDPCAQAAPFPAGTAGAQEQVITPRIGGTAFFASWPAEPAGDG